MQAITTTYLHATKTKGERVKAITTSGQTLTMPWDYEQEAFRNHSQVARLLAEKLGWGGRYSGAVLNANGYVFVQHYAQVSFTV